MNRGATQKEIKNRTDDTKPLISVIVPVYNTAQFLGECIDSVLKQTYKKFEIICVDDGSTDNSYSILEYYQKKDKRVKCFRQSNAGQSAARNFGLSVAQGDYVCFLDSDDYLYMNTFVQCTELFEKHKIDVVLFNMEMFMPNGVHFPCFTGRFFQSNKPIMSSRKDEISINFTNAAPGMYSRKLLVENNIQFPKNMIYEDWVFMINLMMVTEVRFFWLNEPLYWYRRNFSKSTTSDISHRCLDLFKAYEMSDGLLSKNEFGQKAKFINDYKIINESIGFYLYRLLESSDVQLVVQYLTKMIQLMQHFSSTYVMQFAGELSNERRNVLFRILKFDPHMSETDLLKEHHKIKKQVYRARKVEAARGKVHLLIQKGAKLLKKIMEKSMPAYRVSVSSRNKLDVVMWQMNEVQHRMKLLEKHMGLTEEDMDSDEDEGTSEQS